MSEMVERKKDAAPTVQEQSGQEMTEGQVGGAPGPETTAPFVYALGAIGYDLRSETRRNSIMQQMDDDPDDPGALLSHLERNPWDASSITWTLDMDGTPVYAIRPRGAFASDTYERLRHFLREQRTEGVERVSIPGSIGGTTTLMTGQVVRTIVPELRGMFSWSVAAIVEAATGVPRPAGTWSQATEAGGERCRALRSFLERVYHGLRNVGVRPQDRAINHAATNAFQITQIFHDAVREGLELDTIEVDRSPVCPPGSDCWDVKLVFFNPQRAFEQARKVYRFTQDVSDVVPATLGEVRSWSVR